MLTKLTRALCVLQLVKCCAMVYACLSDSRYKEACIHYTCIIICQPLTAVLPAGCKSRPARHLHFTSLSATTPILPSEGDLVITCAQPRPLQCPLAPGSVSHKSSHIILCLCSTATACSEGDLIINSAKTRLLQLRPHPGRCVSQVQPHNMVLVLDCHPRSEGDLVIICAKTCLQHLRAHPGRRVSRVQPQHGVLVILVLEVRRPGVALVEAVVPVGTGIAEEVHPLLLCRVHILRPHKASFRSPFNAFEVLQCFEEVPCY